MATDATRVMGIGADVVLADGKTYEVRFDFEALEIIENEIGPLDAMLRVLNQPGWKKRRVSAIITVMWATLAHTGMKREEVRRLLVFRDIGAYLDALVTAFNNAMPKAEGPQDPNANGTGGSPGQTSTGLPRGSSGARRKRSRG